MQCVYWAGNASLVFQASNSPLLIGAMENHLLRSQHGLALLTPSVKKPKMPPAYLSHLVSCVLDKNVFSAHDFFLN